MKTTEQKRSEALERQEAHDALNVAQKIRKATLRPGQSTKEIERLGRILEKDMVS